MRNERPDVSAVVIVSLREVLGRGSERADRLYEWVQKKAMLSRSQGGHFRLRSLFELDMLAFRTSFRFLQSSDHNHTCSKTLSVLSVQIMYFQQSSRHDSLSLKGFLSNR